jgi:uncharacterized protein YdeI (BOF family)
MITIPDRFRSKPYVALAAVALFAAGGGVGAAAMSAAKPVIVMAPATPTSIASLSTATQPMFGERIVTVRGKVTEVFGNSFVVADQSGRILIDRGPRGTGQPIVAVNEMVSVQGRVDDGVMRPRFLVGADGMVTELGGPGDRPHPPHGRPGDGPGPGGPAPDAPPPPPDSPPR